MGTMPNLYRNVSIHMCIIIYVYHVYTDTFTQKRVHLCSKVNKESNNDCKQRTILMTHSSIRTLGHRHIVLYFGLSVYPSACISVYMYEFLSVFLSLCVSVCLSVCLPVCLSVCLSLCLSLYLSVSNPDWQQSHNLISVNDDVDDKRKRPRDEAKLTILLSRDRNNEEQTVTVSGCNVLYINKQETITIPEPFISNDYLCPHIHHSPPLQLDTLYHVGVSVFVCFCDHVTDTKGF